MWFDGEWDKDCPTRNWPYDTASESNPNSGLKHGERWEWARLYETIHRLQPGCLVVNNSNSLRPGQVRYHPVDLRTCQHFHFVYNEKLCEARTAPVLQRPDDQKIYLPLEYGVTLTPD